MSSPAEASQRRGRAAFLARGDEADGVYRVLEGCVFVSVLRAWETHISTVAF
jgi:hypothetical protein